MNSQRITSGEFHNGQVPTNDISISIILLELELDHVKTDKAIMRHNDVCWFTHKLCIWKYKILSGLEMAVCHQLLADDH